MISYESFIASKIKRIQDCGFDVEEGSLNQMLFPFQKFIVKTALKKGKYAIFADCGLGKTAMQLEWAHHVVIKTDKPVLILCPLAVAGQTIQEGVKFGIPVLKWEHNANLHGIFISNYEQIENIDCSVFGGIVLDESSILKNYNGATYHKLLEAFYYTRYKLCCTATPSPNDNIELANHVEFLGLMRGSEMLTMYFTHDGGVEMIKWKLKGHSVERFWQFVSTWATMVSKPEDIGFPMPGYDLPKLHYIQKEVKAPVKSGLLFNEVSVSATDFNSTLRITLIERTALAQLIVNNSKENFIVWVKQNVEADTLKKLIPDAIEVRGDDTQEYKEKYLLGFANNEFRVLLTKPRIAMYGLNYQNCHNQVFVAPDFSFEGLYQAIRRSYRFGQKNEVNVYLIVTDNMLNVLASLRRKQKQFEHMQHQMSLAISKNLINESSN